jgi:hypothetical protein
MPSSSPRQYSAPDGSTRTHSVCRRRRGIGAFLQLRFAAASAAFVHLLAAQGQDAGEPGRQRPCGVVAVRAIDGGDERRLQRVLGIARVAAQLPRQREQPRRRPVEHLRQRVRVARLAEAQEQFLERVHRTPVPLAGPGRHRNRGHRCGRAGGSVHFAASAGANT